MNSKPGTWIRHSTFVLCVFMCRASCFIRCSRESSFRYVFVRNYLPMTEHPGPNAQIHAHSAATVKLARPHWDSTYWPRKPMVLNLWYNITCIKQWAGGTSEGTPHPEGSTLLVLHTQRAALYYLFTTRGQHLTSPPHPEGSTLLPLHNQRAAPYKSWVLVTVTPPVDLYTNKEFILNIYYHM